MAATEDLRLFSGEEVLSAVEGVENYCSKEQKAELSGYLKNLNAHQNALSKEVEGLKAANEEGKAERREVFLKKRKKSLIFFAATAVPFLVFLILGIYFASVMHAVKDGRNIIFTIVFFAVAGVLFVVLLFAAHMLWDSAKKVSLNEKNSSTQIGREYESKREELSLLCRIISAVESEQNDLS